MTRYVSTCAVCLGTLGKVCGGYNVKGRGDDIALSLMAPADDRYTYHVTMDFIKIDDWFVSLAVSSNAAVVMFLLQ